METWKPVHGYEGLYEVSSYGRIRSLYRYKKILKPMISNAGYERVDLFKEKKRKQFSVHRLVATAFVPNLRSLPMVNHIDENKLNNHAKNLEWVTAKENANHGTAKQRAVAHTDYKAMNRPNKKTQIDAVSKPVIQLTLDGEFVNEWASASECYRKTGFSISGIRRCANGERKQAHGYLWEEKK